MRAPLICSHVPSVPYQTAVAIAARVAPGGSPEAALERELAAYTDEPGERAIDILVDIEVPLFVRYVWSQTGLKLRVSPETGPILRVLGYGQAVEVWYVDKRGWAFVTQYNEGGWCASVYLEKTVAANVQRRTRSTRWSWLRDLRSRLQAPWGL